MGFFGGYGIGTVARDGSSKGNKYISAINVVEDDDKSVQCDLYDRWIHIKCAEINHQKYEKLKKDLLAWHCADCLTEIPFSTLSKKDFEDFLYSTTTPQPV